jgi:hypothetical protein
MADSIAARASHATSSRTSDKPRSGTSTLTDANISRGVVMS